MLQIAVEEALRVKEAKLAEEVVAVSIGPKQARAGGQAPPRWPPRQQRHPQASAGMAPPPAAAVLRFRVRVACNHG